MSKTHKKAHRSHSAISGLTSRATAQPLGHRTKYIYDGFRVIQERDGNNNPLASYTRGTDLSGTMGGAGGIGGLLARSSGYSGGSWTSHAYYHADGNGNVTFLVDSSQNLAASYRYDPYGNLISSSGTLANANVYRFSSKEYLTNSAIYYYLDRLYDPNLQRWGNRDPLGDDGFMVAYGHSNEVMHVAPVELSEGANLYCFVVNNPLRFYDCVGLSRLTCDDCNKFLKDQLDQLRNEIAADGKTAVYRGTLFTVGGIAISRFSGWAGVIIGGAGDLWDLWDVGNHINDVQERMKAARHLYNLCIDRLTSGSSK